MGARRRHKLFVRIVLLLLDDNDPETCGPCRSRLWGKHVASESAESGDETSYFERRERKIV